MLIVLLDVIDAQSGVITVVCLLNRPLAIIAVYRVQDGSAVVVVVGTIVLPDVVELLVAVVMQTP